MKTKPLFFLLLLIPALTVAQDMNITFDPADDNYVIDSITAMNVRTGESITFPGDETLILSSGTGIDNLDEKQIKTLVYPNPNNGECTMVVNIPEQQDVVISVLNQLGQIVCQKEESVQPGTHAFSLCLESAGLYFISIQHRNGHESIQLVSTKNNILGNQITRLARQSGSKSQKTFKRSNNAFTLAYVFGDPIRFYCYSDVHQTIFQEQPREIMDYNYEVEFYSCIDDDRNVYPAIEINEQVWMGRNLSYLPSINIPSEEDGDNPHYYVSNYQTGSVSEAKETDEYKTYGVLYNWSAANTSCPSGWHLSTDEEWKSLEVYLGMSEAEADNMEAIRVSGDVGEKLKSKHLWLNDGTGNDEYAFGLIPDGWFGDGQFQQHGTRGSYWTSDEVEDNAVFRSFVSSTDGVWRGAGGKQYASSVRCLKDAEVSKEGIMTDYRDWTNYKTIKIGTQTWMAQNLAYLPAVYPATEGSDNGSAVPYYYVYDYQGSAVEEAKATRNYKTYGALYNWHAAIDACPWGWHLASDEDWKVLEGYLGMSESAQNSSGMRTSGNVGEKLKSTSGWDNNGNGLDSYGFNSIPAGWRDMTQIFQNNGSATSYVSSTSVGGTSFKNRYINSSSNGIGRTDIPNNGGGAVRCVKNTMSYEGTMTDERDGKAYKTIKIGTQTWLAENMAWLPNVSNSTDESTTDPYYYVYDYEGSDVNEAKETEHYKTYGTLYNFPAALIACPDGWRLPSDEDFFVLEEFLGMDQSELLLEGIRSSGLVGKKLKSETNWENDGNGKDAYGFNLLPAGNNTGGFRNLGKWTGMWTTTVSSNSSNRQWGRGAWDNSDGFQRDDAVKNFAYSVRCIKNE